MRPHWLSNLFSSERPLAYVSVLAGKRYATQWTIYRGKTEDGLDEFEFLLELDPAALGQGGSLLKQRSRLVVGPSLDPVRYRSEANSVRWSMEFEATEVKVELPDGSRQTVPRGGAQFALDSSMPGQMALILAELSERGAIDGEASFLAFSVNQFVAIPYRVSPAPEIPATSGRWLRTSHHEEILIEGGVMQLSRLPKQAIETRLDAPGPALPGWRHAASLARPALRYAPPANARFRLEDVTIPGPSVPIGGTLTIPPGQGPFPSVLFVSGTGTHDRHGIAGGEVDIGTHQIVDYLAEQGFLGLRYDTRGAGTTKLGDDALDQGLEAVLGDARAALDFLCARPEGRGCPVFLIGHSRGGTVGMVLAAERETAIQGLVLMASMGRNIDEVIADQLVQQGRRMGLNDAQIAQQQAELAELVQAIREDRPWEPDAIPDYLFGAARSRTWFKEHLAYSPTELIRKVRCPILLCQGAKDFQVSPERDAERLVHAASEAGVDCTYLLFPDLDHLFMHTEGESTLEKYYEPGRRVEQTFLERLAAWLRARSDAAALGA